MDEIEEFNESIKKAKEELRYLASDPRLREEYKDRMKALRDHISFSSYERKKNLEEGRKEGRKEGREQGSKENQIEIAKKLLAKNMPIEEISEITGLSVNEIKTL